MKRERKSIIVLAAMFSAAIIGLADVPVKQSVPVAKPVSNDRACEMIRDVRNMRGSVLFVNAQKRLDVAAAIDSAIAALDGEFHYDIRRAEAGCDVTLADGTALRKSLKATVAVFIVDRKDIPALSAFPDDSVAFLNIAPYADGADDRHTAKRVRLGALRAFAFAFGAGFSQYDALLMSPVDSPLELDIIPAKAFLPFDSAIVIRKVAAARGLSPYRTEFYETACEEGWAPAPRNAAQKEIWDKVHQVPTEPIKIKPESKKVVK